MLTKNIDSDKWEVHENIPAMTSAIRRLNDCEERYQVTTSSGVATGRSRIEAAMRNDEIQRSGKQVFRASKNNINSNQLRLQATIWNRISRSIGK